MVLVWGLNNLVEFSRYLQEFQKINKGWICNEEIVIGGKKRGV